MPYAVPVLPFTRSNWPLFVAVVLLLAPLAVCGGPAQEPRADGYCPRLPTTTVTFPNGNQVEAELAMTPEQQSRGLMFRTHLPPHQGMLFVGDRAAPRSFWMFQCRIALDMLWLDGGHRIVEIVRDVPPCPDPDPENCPSYGGNLDSVYVLELAAGQAEAQGLRVGDRLEF